MPFLYRILLPEGCTVYFDMGGFRVRNRWCSFLRSAWCILVKSFLYCSIDAFHPSSICSTLLPTCVYVVFVICYVLTFALDVQPGILVAHAIYYYLKFDKQLRLTNWDNNPKLFPYLTFNGRSMCLLLHRIYFAVCKTFLANWIQTSLVLCAPLPQHIGYDHMFTYIVRTIKLS